MSDALVFSKYIRLRDAEAITGLVTFLFQMTIIELLMHLLNFQILNNF